MNEPCLRTDERSKISIMSIAAWQFFRACASFSDSGASWSTLSFRLKYQMKKPSKERRELMMVWAREPKSSRIMARSWGSAACSSAVGPRVTSARVAVRGTAAAGVVVRPAVSILRPRPAERGGGAGAAGAAGAAAGAAAASAAGVPRNCMSCAIKSTNVAMATGPPGLPAVPAQNECHFSPVNHF